MERLRKVIAQYGRWSSLSVYSDHIDAYISTDFSIALENAKALLESIGKEICGCKNIALESNSSVNGVLKKAFSAVGYPSSSAVLQISSALATIAQNIGEIRNDIGITSHGRSMEEIKARNEKYDPLTRAFLIDTTVIVACFLIRSFENENPWVKEPADEINQAYDSFTDFNDYWDESYGEFEMGDYSYSASEILYNLDYKAYISEQKAYVEGESWKE